MGGCDIPAVGGPPLRHDGTVGTDGRWAGRRASHGPGGRAGPGARGGPASSTRRAPWCFGPTCWPWLSRRGRAWTGATGSSGPPRRCSGCASRLCWLDLSDVAREGIRRGHERDPERPRRPQGFEYRGGVADTPWRLRRSCHPTQLVGATVYTNAPKRLWADLLALVEPPGTGVDRCDRQLWPAETLLRMRLALVLAGPVRRCPRGHPEGPREGPGTSEEAAGVRIPRGRRRHTMAVEALVPPDTARGCNSVHKCPETAPRGRFSRSVYTPASPRPLARPGRPRVPRRRRPHGPRDARVLGPETHAAGAATQPHPHTNSQSLRKSDRWTGVLAGAEHLFCVSLVNLACKHKEQGLMKQVDEQRMSAYESERTKTALKDPGGQRVSRKHDAHVCAHEVHEAKGE